VASCAAHEPLHVDVVPVSARKKYTVLPFAPTRICPIFPTLRNVTAVPPAGADVGIGVVTGVGVATVVAIGTAVAVGVLLLPVPVVAEPHAARMSRLAVPAKSASV